MEEIKEKMRKKRRNGEIKRGQNESNRVRKKGIKRD